MNWHGSQELLLVILAIAIEMEPDALPPALDSERDKLVDVLRSESLKLMPPLALNSADLRLSQCTALILASYTWCMKEDLVQIARRWNDLAKLIWNEMRSSDMNNGHLESTARIGRAIQLQATVLDLLHHSRVSWPVDAETHTNPALSPLCYASPTTEFGSCTNASSRAHDYFSLFFPLLGLLQNVLSSARDLESMKRIRDSLELFYLDFPPELLEFSSAKSPYQIEAMIWFHGIFILTFVRQDLLDILIDETLPMRDDFYSVLEHAILLGEPFPTLLRLDPGLRQISPATVFLINLSSTIIASAMWQFHCCIDLDTSSTLLVDPPESLVVIMRHHQEALKALTGQKSRYDLEFIGAISDILSSLCTGLTSETYQTLQKSLYVVAHYCWHDDGNGISRLATGARGGIVQTRAMSANITMLCRVQLPPVAEPEDVIMRRATIQALCSPEARICQGCFDLSIQF
ncbi:hypothetical protein LCI18_013430 [Fusarium solani-melongenae]|uniref:Uncharacterized protein n=1 Tax=Fusarium solani subsp. cucurbitae TaxID=2747967 RepID=A0ACD3ZMP5_FUSSC|nr:hypothetical protein LCI18_013430 [Fusarium solani-melongenae]